VIAFEGATGEATLLGRVYRGFAYGAGVYREKPRSSCAHLTVMQKITQENRHEKTFLAR
jgi:hypothetical protein